MEHSVAVSYTHLDVYKRQDSGELFEVQDRIAYDAPQMELNTLDATLPQTTKMRG